MSCFGLLAVVLAGTVQTTSIEPVKLRQADSYLRAATKALETGNVPKARTQFEKALEAVPAFPEAHIGLGIIALGEKKPEEALQRFLRARDGYAEVGDALLDLQTRRYRDSQEEAMRLREQIDGLRRQDDRAQGGVDQATRENQIRGLESRLRQLEAIDVPVHSDRHDPPGEVFFHLGTAYFHLQRYDEARVAWETCAEKSPKLSWVHNNLAVLYYKAGRLAEAEASIAKAETLGLKVNPQFKADLERAKTQRR